MKKNITQLRYQLFCAACGTVLGYTDHKFAKGDILSSASIYYANGEQGKPTDVIRCDPMIPGYHYIKIGQNPVFMPTIVGGVT